VNIDRSYPLEAIVEAQAHNRSGHTRGKVVVDMGVAAGPVLMSAPGSARRSGAHR
jgi:hypothetical protein